MAAACHGQRTFRPAGGFIPKVINRFCGWIPQSFGALAFSPFFSCSDAYSTIVGQTCARLCEGYIVSMSTSSPSPSFTSGLESFRRYSLTDTLIGQVDHVLNNIFCKQPSSRPYPATGLPDDDAASTPITMSQKRAAAGLMRVNHAGEVSAQALYQGQSLTARDPSLRDRLGQASIEESDHLNWCRRRLQELDAGPSKLDPFWYMGSLALGMAAGIAGDRWNLGFLAETEYQVVRHLDDHLAALPEHDARSRAIVTQMKEDELGHAHLAEDLGAADLPPTVKALMKLTSKIMTGVAERI